ncbi:Thioredoxin [Arenibacter nanhaiticus]|uniref:Thioredoxin n=1 Tax=Arenibacter nanhaiticus TaxID=558155 RepID=A0A1M6JMT9_9FLAO|nr:thioredoxin family protein [Arenibacter nanhaiticus]SHJ47996.1 Thioredoxin [Arenibacter nanhaiticus]
MEQEILKKSTSQIIQESLSKAMSYEAYRALTANLVSKGASTAAEQSDDLAHYTLINEQRMKRLDKTLKIDPASEALITAVQRKTTWLVLTESWCGDAAQSLPVMNKIADLNSNLTLKLVLRDENLPLMERFLTNGGMGIPKLIAIDEQSGKLIGEWGSRPFQAQKMVDDFKEEHGQFTPEFKEDLQQWYNKDKGKNTLQELVALLTLE